MRLDNGRDSYIVPPVIRDIVTIRLDTREREIATRQLQKYFEQLADVQKIKEGKEFEHIFISYSHKDMNAMRKVRDHFHKSNFKVWTDEGIEPGTPSWLMAIEDAIVSASCLVCLFSPDAKISTWVRDELAFAKVHQKTIFPILVNGNPSEAVPFGFAAAQWVDIRENDSALEKLSQTIAKRFID